MIDEDDLISNTSDIMNKLCAIVGVDVSGVGYEWNAVPPEDRKKADAAFLATIQASTGAIRDEVRLQHLRYLEGMQLSWFV